MNKFAWLVPAMVAVLAVGRGSPIAAEGVMFTVTSTADTNDGACDADCTLREAIGRANVTPGADTIAFAIPARIDAGCDNGSGVCTIAPAVALPGMTDPVTLDGYTQPGAIANTSEDGSNALLNIELSGANAGVSSGLHIDGGNSTVRGLAINRFANTGIVVGSNDNVIEGNFLGTDVSGTSALANGDDGLLITGSGNTIGGSSAAARNVISGNGRGVELRGSANVVAGNLIGTNAGGVEALGNGGDGVFVTGNATANTIGGTAPGTRNVISGNGLAGVEIQSSGNVVQGNDIGTDVTGSADVGNGLEGVLLNSPGGGNTVGGAAAGARNVISGNGAEGVKVQSSGNSVLGNLIGTRADGVGPLGNALHGLSVFLNGGNNAIGGTVASEGNVIAHNGGDGVFVSSGTGNAVHGNSIHSNTGLGIDLGPVNGLSANDAGDADTGANNRQNFPLLTSVASGGGSTTIEGTLNSTASTSFTIEFLYSAACDRSFYGEGATSFGAVMTTTNESGNGAFSASFSADLPAGSFVTATAIDADGNTSEFSASYSSGAVAAGPSEDDDCDGVLDAAEVMCESDPLVQLQRPERSDGVFAGVSDDGDAEIDESLPPGASGSDCDGDGFRGSTEARVGLSDQDACGTNGWPAEFVKTAPSANKLTLLDVTSFVAPVRRLGTSPGEAGYSVRWDIGPTGMPKIALPDLSALTAPAAGSSNPPMFGEQRALDGPACPWAP